MSAKRTVDGLWWFPSSPGERWLGRLSLEPGELPELTISIPKGHDADALKVPSVLHGCYATGRPITLLDSHQHGSNIADVLADLHCAGSCAILGLHVAAKTEFIAHSLTLHLQHLYGWAAITGFERDEGMSVGTTTITLRRPEPFAVALDEDLSIEVDLMPSLRDEGWQKSLAERTCVRVRSKKGLTYEDCHDWLGLFRSLLHFAVLTKVYPTKVQAANNACGRKLHETFIPTEIELFTSLIREPVESEFFPDRWVFQLPDVRGRFASFVQGWRSFRGRFEEALNCYFATVYSRLPSEMTHLCLAQALEAYHGVKFTSHEDRDFAVKIRELAEVQKTSLAGLVDDPAAFSEIVRDNRNYYTHHNPKWLKTGRVVNGAGLIQLNEKMMLLFQMCVLTEMGIPEDRFSSLRRQLAQRIVEFS